MQTIIGTAFNAILLGLAMVALGAIFGRLHPTIDLFGQFLLPAIVGSAGLAVLAALTGRYATTALAAVALFANLVIAWPWITAPAPTEATGPRFKLLLLNVYYNNPRLEVAAQLIRDTSPDIVVLLEMIPRLRPGFDAIAAAYPHRVECWQLKQCDALILSRYPLQDIRDTLPSPQYRRPMGAVRVSHANREFTLFATHLSLPPLLEGRSRQPNEIKEITLAVNSVPGARLIVGDFNASTWGAIVTHVREKASLTALTGPGGTWPTFLPLHMGIPIDHVLTSDELVAHKRELVTIAGTDHRAVLAEIAFKN
jgi:endonuclease/exonuclease/phosphatase (EEP) superfamily protein YafD